MTDIQAKYQKLAAEYAKLRAQVPVLKKAVVDEQAKQEELTDLLKERDTSLRKYEQEVDSLTFRNQQLSSRVSILQEELASVSTKQGKKHKKNTPALPNEAISCHEGVISEELKGKIEENARLHQKVQEADTAHKEEVFSLQDRLDRLESEASKHEQLLRDATEQSQTHISRLEEERVLLEVKVQKLETECKGYKERTVKAEEELASVQQDLGSQLCAAHLLIRDKLPYNDTENSELCALNVPCHDRQRQLETRELVNQSASLLEDLTQGFINFYTYSEQRALVYPTDGQTEPRTDVNKRLCQCLHENASILRPVQQAFQDFTQSLRDDSLTTLETTTGLQKFASAFKGFSQYAAKLLPYQQLSLEEECNVSSCTSSLRNKNQELKLSLKTLVSAITKVDTYIGLLAQQSSDHTGHPRSNRHKMFSLLANALNDLNAALKTVSQHYNSKVSLEHQLPTATHKLKTTDECTVSALVSLVTCSTKISAFFTANIEFFSREVGYMVRGVKHSATVSAINPSVDDYRTRASNYITLINKPCAPSVPYKNALENRSTLFSSTESRDSLYQQVEQQREQLSRVEQDKEHWMLEAQLLSMKLEKMEQKVTSVEKKLKIEALRKSGSIEDNLEAETMMVNQSEPATTHHTSLLGEVEVSGGGDQRTEEEREALIRSHYIDRIAGLTSKQQLADSKALHYHAECRALSKRLSLANKDKERLEGDNKTSSQTITQLKDELQTTTKSYESQLSMMSEHLAGMNERLASQNDQINVLTYQLQNKPSSKKGLPKLGR